MLACCELPVLGLPGKTPSNLFCQSICNTIKTAHHASVRHEENFVNVRRNLVNCTNESDVNIDPRDSVLFFCDKDKERKSPRIPYDLFIFSSRHRLVLPDVCRIV
ncbi:hypothetical protein OUZ56_031031 [Daphnia magna]|uniref:GMP synthase n=1 Tax=Daphnia magna TaxID=35525 RepID=A0ABQ9ZT10_9CRUS|nr:hypothetical protein OUZ56_031031 [Daphnia magna]